MDRLALPSFAKINLDLRIERVRPDGYHELNTIFQSLALHDTIRFVMRPGPFEITCDDPHVPRNERNLIWQAAAALWGRGLRRRGEPRDVAVRLQKRVPQRAGLGGGSANAAVTLLALARLWQANITRSALERIGARVGADVPFFFVGGTARGRGRGDEIQPLGDVPRTFVVIVRPRFGVSTADAYRWYDETIRREAPDRRAVFDDRMHWAAGFGNDLELPVAARHPTIRRIRTALVDAGAGVSAMSGSGSAIFGLFKSQETARHAAAALARPGSRVIVTRTLTRAEYARRLQLVLARSRNPRIS